MNDYSRVVVIACATFLVASSVLTNEIFAQPLGDVEMILTRGESGLPGHNVFYVGEKVFATLRITGLNDRRPYTGQIQVTGQIFDGDGSEVLMVEKEPEYYLQVLGGDSIETTLVIDSDGKNIPPGNYSFSVTVQHVETGRKYNTRCNLVYQKPESLCVSEFCWFLDSEKLYPTGPVFQPVRMYSLSSRVMNYSVADRKIGVQMNSGVAQPAGGQTEEQHITETFTKTMPPDSKLPERIWYDASYFWRRRGDFWVTQSVLDLPTGNETTSRSPITVQGRELPTEATKDRVELFMEFTYGLHGAIRKPKYLANEDIWVTLGALNVPVMEPTTLNYDASFLDGAGTVLSKVALRESSFRRDSQEGIYIGEWQIPVDPNQMRFDAIKEIEIQMTDRLTGKVSCVSSPLDLLPLNGLSAFNYRFTCDAQGATPGGRFLTAGQDYFLKCDIAKFAIEDYAIDVTHSVKAFTDIGQPITGTELVLEHKRALSVSEKLEGQLPLGMQISLNRPGKFLLRSTFTDNISGETYTTDIPVEVVSPFQFVKEEAPPNAR